PEVDDHRARVEAEQEVLGAADDGAQDARALRRAGENGLRERLRHRPAQAVEAPDDTCQPMADERLVEPPAYNLHFRELGHFSPFQPDSRARRTARLRPREA